MTEGNNRYTPEVLEIIKQLTDEYNSQKIPAVTIYNNKVNDLIELIDTKFRGKCHKELEEFNKISADSKTNSSDNSNKAFEDLENCYKPFKQMKNHYSTIFFDFPINIFANQTYFCFDDCQTKYGSSENVKGCIRGCIESTRNYSLRALYELYNPELDRIKENFIKL
jgi:hypothetical protein